MKWQDFHRFLPLLMTLASIIALQTNGNHTTYAVLAVFWMLAAIYEQRKENRP